MSYRGTTLAIVLNAAVSSNELSEAELRRAKQITFFAPAALDGALTFEANDGAGNWRTIQVAGADFSIAVGKCGTLFTTNFSAIRAKTSVNQTAARSITTRMEEET